MMREKKKKRRKEEAEMQIYNVQNSKQSSSYTFICKEEKKKYKEKAKTRKSYTKKVKIQRKDNLQREEFIEGRLF